MIVDDVARMIDEFYMLQRESTERQFTELIKNYDFIVGSPELKEQLGENFHRANVIYSRLLDDPTVVYMIKRFNISPLSYESDEELKTLAELREIRNEITSMHDWEFSRGDVVDLLDRHIRGCKDEVKD